MLVRDVTLNKTYEERGLLSNIPQNLKDTQVTHNFYFFVILLSKTTMNYFNAIKLYLLQKKIIRKSEKWKIKVKNSGSSHN